MNEIFLYVLALAARRYGVQVHAACVLSNHYHLLVTDPRAQLPAFVQYLDALVARATNATLKRWEAFWAGGCSFSAVTNASREDVVRKAAYILANPVAAGLVRHGEEWPGIRTAPDQLAMARLSASRPEGFFRSRGGLPEVVELELTAPPGFSSRDEFRAAVAAAVAEMEGGIRRGFAAKGRAFLGRARVLAHDPFSRPETIEPRRNASPRIAAIDRWKRIEAVHRMMQFVRDYRRALAALRAGIRDVVFPAGTYRLRIELGVRCAAPA